MLSYSFCNIKTEKNYIQKKVLNIIRAIYTTLTIWKLLDYKKIKYIFRLNKRMECFYER